MSEKSISSPIAIIDIGSHAVRMEIAQLNKQGEKELLTSLEDSVPLGANVFKNGRISSKNIDSVCEILLHCKSLMSEFGVEEYRAFATSAVSEAENKYVFFNRVKIKTGITVTLLEPSKTVQYAYMAVKDAISGRFAFKNKNALICSIGTGSTVVAYVENGALKGFENFKFGSLRIIYEIPDTGVLSNFSDSILPYVKNTVGAILAKVNSKLDMIIMIGGTARAILKIAKESHDVKVSTMKKKDFAKLSDSLSANTNENIADIYGIPDSISEGLDPCRIFAERLMKKSSLDKIIVATVNTRDVVLKNLFVNSTGKYDVFSKEIISSTKFLGHKYLYDSEHANTVTEHALKLFDRLQNLHVMGTKERLILEVAAQLHDIGQFVGNRKHHKHSFYLLSNSSLPGLTDDEMFIIAIICRYHRKSMPKISHAEYSNLSSGKKLLVCKLASILRIADVLDRSHTSRIAIRKIVFDNKKLSIHVKSSLPDIFMENTNFQKKFDLFSQTFGLDVEIIGV